MCQLKIVARLPSESGRSGRQVTHKTRRWCMKRSSNTRHRTTMHSWTTGRCRTDSEPANISICCSCVSFRSGFTNTGQIASLL